MKIILSWLFIAVFYMKAKGLDNVGVDLVVKELNSPVWLTATQAYPDYLFILEKAGRVLIFDKKQGELLAEPFLDIRDKVTIKIGEQGLLCLSFSPDFAKTGRYYIYLTNNQGDTEVIRYSTQGLTTDKNQGELLLKIKQDYANHNGGWMGFGPDGALYIATGDGGSSFDPKNRSLDLNSYLGKILRLDVSLKTGYSNKGNPFIGKTGVKPEIFAYGLRNPWRCAWDGEDLYIADVGQNKWEEINKVNFTELKGANFGWSIYEGLEKTSKKLESIKTTWVKPIYTYPHDNSVYGGWSVNGGYVYRGPIKSLQGHYFFSDWIRPHIWSFNIKDAQNGITTKEIKNWSEQLMYQDQLLRQLVSFGEDADKNLYLISHNGEIYQLIEK